MGDDLFGQEIISFINDNFIPVRVDADMRPDIDTLYNQGGCLAAILTPQEKSLVAKLYPTGEKCSGGSREQQRFTAIAMPS
jgi:uncharacterized protein YyaL (SSP411 family)